jgi:LPXTG-site transpeptidase (sortase) family protein
MNIDKFAIPSFHRFWGAILILIVVGGMLGLPNGGVESVQAAAEQPAPPALPLAADPPVVTLSGLGDAMIGSAISFTVTFDNNDPENEPGYGPFIEFELPTVGVDGNDGLTFVSASYLSSPIPAQDLFVSTFDAGGNAVHPLVRDVSGAYINVTGTAGDQLVVIRLPFGSFTKDQPPAPVRVTVQMSNLADLGMPLTVRARGGYQYGWSPLDDWCCDLIVPTLSGYASGSVNPTVMTLAKTYTGPGNTSAETATGPNFTRQYTVSVSIAPGQETRIANLTITDRLDNNVQYVPTATGVPVAGFTLIDQPVSGAAQNPPNNDLIVRWASLPAGTTTASTSFSFFVPRDLASPPGGRVIDASTGNTASTCNNAAVTGTWTPLDPRDLPASVQTIDPGGCEHTLTDRSIATQKGVSYSGTLAPGTTLVYTIQVQVSDFFAFDGLSLTDLISDGQHFDAGFTPTMSVAGNGFSLGAAAMTNYTVVSNKDLSDGPPPPPPLFPPENPATDGTTSVTFNISPELAARAIAEIPGGPASNHALAGRLLGGCVPLAGSASPDCGSYNYGATTVTIVFHAVVDENFSDVYPSGDWSVDQGDILRDRETVTGNVLNTLTFAASGSSITDDATASLTLATGSLTKSIYAINGTPCPRGPLDLVCPTGGSYRIKPGDTVTYRITYVMPTSDEENLEFTDYLPLPIFDATQIASFDNIGQSGQPGVIPAVGHANFGQSDTFYTYSSISPTLTSSSTNNSVNFFYGDFDDPRDQSTTVDLLLTATVSSRPFADGLYLTNQAHANEGSTNGGTVPADAIVQLVLTEPVLVTSKSAIWTSNSNATFSPVTPAPPVTFLAPGPGVAPRWSGTINSTNLYSSGTSTIDHDVSGVDAGDIVTFAIVIENQGTSLKGAFDIDILDTLPGDFQMPASGYNLQIFYGNGTGDGEPLDPSINYTRPNGAVATPGDLFTTGIRLVDPVGQGVCQAHDPNLGNNIILITYDLEVSSTVAPGTMTNTGTITHYAGDEGGPTHVPTPSPLHDDAGATTLTSMTKTLVGTEINTAVNSSTQAVIGELATYRLVVTVPEGTVPAAQIVDTLDSGLAFVDLDPANPPVLSSGVTITGSTSPAITNSGQTVTFNLGDVTNTNRVNTTPDTITLTYRGVGLNVLGNQTATGLNNSAVYTWTGGSQLAVSANDVTVIEPVVTVTKQSCDNAVDPCTVVSNLDAGDALFYRIQLTGGVTDAFDLTFSDPLPTVLNSPSIASVTGANPADFQIVTGTLQTTGSADIDLAPAASIVIYVQGIVSYSVTPGQSIPNTGTVLWTSLNGNMTDRSTYNTDSDERTGADGVGGALNDYAARSTATVTVFTITPVKSIVSTSESHTSESGTGGPGSPRDLAIGEVIRYRLSVELPEGTSSAFTLTDTLPAGFTYLANSADVIFLTTDHNTTESIDLAGADAGSLPPTFPVPSGRVSVVGQNVAFFLGDLVNNDDDADAEYIVIDLDVLVNNDANNNNTDLDNNFFSVSIGGSSAGTSNNVGTRIVEPVIPVGVNTKTVNTVANRDAGDSATYTITYTNSGLADAFEVRLYDDLPETYLDLTAVNIGPASFNAACQSPTVTNASDLGTDIVDVTIDRVRVGCTVTFTYDVTLRTAVTPNQTITNTANLTYTSLSGSGTQTPGASGAANGERNGTSGGVNDYNGSDTAQFTTRTVARAKTLFDTEVNILGNTNTQATLGEIVTYRLVITVPEGTTPSLQVVDTLGANMAVTDVCVSGYPAAALPIAASAGVSTSLAGGFADACNDGTGVNNPVISAFGGTNGRRITWQLGTITNSDTNNANPETITIYYQAVMLNVAANQAGTTRSNSAVVSWTGNPGSAITTNVVIVEATVNTGKSVSAGPYDAGNVVTYTITLTNPAGSTTAFDTTLNDPLSAYISAASITGVSGGGFTPSDFSVTGCPGACVLQTAAAAGIDIPASTTVTITLDATLSAAVPAGQIVGNTATTQWTSMNGTVGDRSTYNANSEERDGTGGLLGGALNDYRTQGAVNLTVATPTVAKQAPSPTRYAIGATVTYPILVTLPEGVTRSLRVIDQVPAGMVYVSSSVDASSFVGTLNTSPAVSPLSPTDGDDMTFTFGDTTTTNDNNGANNSFLLNVTLRVLDVPANQIGSTLTNGAVLRYLNPNTGVDAPDVPGGTQDISVSEPRIVTTKDTVPTPLTGVQAGNLVTYRVLFTNTNNPLTNVSTAYEVSAMDSLAQGMDFTSLTSCLLDSPATDLTGVTTVDTSIPGQVTLSGSAWDIPAGSTITCLYTATAQSSLYLDGSHLNTVDADWTSLDSVDVNERTYDDSVVRTVDGTQDSDTASFSADAPTIVKDDGGVIQVVVGDTITFTLTIGGPVGTLRSAVVTDHLPAGLIYNNDAVITGLPSVVPTVSAPNDGTVAVTLTWTFGDAYKSLTNATIVYSTRVADTSAVVLGGTLLNSVWLDHHYADDTSATRQTSSASSTVTEPVITTTKTAAPLSGVQAGDTVSYEATFTNTGTSTAYDITAEDVLPAHTDYNADAVCLYYNGSVELPINVSVIVTTDIPTSVSTLHFDGNPAGSWDVPVGNYVRCTYSVTAHADIPLGGGHINTVDADWSSKNGTFSGERIYADSVVRPGVDGSQDTASASFTTAAPVSIDKVISDGAGNDVTQVRIGDTFHITITINSPLGALTSTRVDDILPVGMIYVGGQSVSGSITPNPSPVVFTVSGPNDGTVPTTLRWDFGNPVVTGNPVVIQYDARAANVPANFDNLNPTGPDLVNNVTFYYTDGAGPGSLSASDSLEVVEAQITTTKDTVPAVLTGIEAGDMVTYNASFANIGNSSAYEVSAVDLLAQGMNFTSLSSCLLTPGAINLTAGTSIDTSTPGQVTFSNPAWDIPVGGNLACTYTTTAQPGLILDGVHTNMIDADWTSLNGGSGNERNYNDTGSSPVDAAQDTDSASFSSDAPSISKSDGGVTHAVIGQTVHITLTITSPLGTLQDARVVDTLPAGLIYYDDGSGGSQTVSSNITPGFGALGFSYSSPNDGTAPVTLTWDFADAVVSGSPVVLQYDAVVANVAANFDNLVPAGPDLVNQVDLYYTDATGNPQDKLSRDSFDVLESALTITKTVSDLYPGPDQRLTFTLTVANTDPPSHATAYDVVIFDDLDARLALVPGTVRLNGADPGPDNHSTASRVESWVASLPVGGSAVVTFDAIVSGAVTPADSIPNTGNVTWTSMPGTPSEERTGSGVGPNDYFDTDALTLNTDKAITKLLIADNHAPTTTPEVAIGELLTYEVLLEFPNPVGPTPVVTSGVTLTDQLDTGLAFVQCLSITPSDAGITTSNSLNTVCTSPAVSGLGAPSNPSSAGRQVVFDFGDVSVSPGSAGRLTIDYQVVVLDVPENQSGGSNTPNNHARLDWSVGYLETHAPDDLIIREPFMLLDKVADQTVATPGSDITFTLTIQFDTAATTADAYDIQLQDTIPAGLTYVPGSLTAVSGNPPTTLTEPPALPSAQTLRVRWDTFPQSPGIAVIQYKATLAALTPGSSVSNTATLEWTSLPSNPGVQSIHNSRSTERRYDPLFPADIYQVQASATVGVPALPKTGFAPGRLTSLPVQLLDRAYASLGDLWLEIPSLGVSTSIVGVPLGSGGWDLTWLGEQAGYLNGTAYPTWSGNTGITGHVYLADGSPGPFVDLHTLVWGQQVIVHMGGQRYIYEVRSMRRVWPDDLSVLQHADLPTLTLITCQGYNPAADDYRTRIAVRAVLVDIQTEAASHPPARRY